MTIHDLADAAVIEMETKIPVYMRPYFTNERRIDMWKLLVKYMARAVAENVRRLEAPPDGIKAHPKSSL